MPTPLIGVTVGQTMHPALGAPVQSLQHSYTRSIALGGGAPVMVPLLTDEAALRAVFDQLDGLVLSGGGDVEPELYGAEASPYTEGINAERDAVELWLARWAIEADKPILAICRGIQVLNVALGGTLIQDIREQVPGALRHDQEPRWFPVVTHEVSITPGSKLHSVLESGRLGVNSLHHQALDQIGEGLQVVGCSDDGVVEAVEHPGCRFAIGVQWHPEALADKDATMRRLFEALARAAGTE